MGYIKDLFGLFCVYLTTLHEQMTCKGHVPEKI